MTEEVGDLVVSAALWAAAGVTLIVAIFRLHPRWQLAVAWYWLGFLALLRAGADISLLALEPDPELALDLLASTDRLIAIGIIAVTATTAHQTRKLQHDLDDETPAT